MSYTNKRTRLVSRQLPLRSTATLAAFPAMSLIPFAPFALGYGSAGSDLPNLYHLYL
jgi:hypothetical protein